jgi:DNA modification methylase
VTVQILTGDCRAVLRTLPDESVHCVVTSPPYWGLRDYKIEPSIWGGDPACAHAWDVLVDETLAKRGRGGSTLEGNSQSEANGRFVKESAFCARCNAWRGAFGLEPTYQLYVDHAVEIFREVRRVLRADGTLWLNLGDCYATGAGKVGERPGGGDQGARWAGTSSERPAMGKHAYVGEHIGIGPATQPNRLPQPNLKPKDLVCIPWRVAMALQADGWWLRTALPWLKRNPMPESTDDRPTTAVEYVFYLTKSKQCFYAYEEMERLASASTHRRLAQNVEAQIGSARANGGAKTNGNMKAVSGGRASWRGSTFDGPRDLEVRPNTGRKRARTGSGIKNNDSMDAALAVMPEARAFRNSDLFFDSLAEPLGAIIDDDGRILALDVTTQPFKGAHFATFPPNLVKPLVIASCPKGGTVLDPFGGAGTTGLVADRLQRNAILIELNPDYAAMAERRIYNDAPLFAEAAE